MSWDNVIIGERSICCSSMTVLEIGECSISKSRDSYWISGVLYGLGMMVNYETEEGRYLMEEIKSGVYLSEEDKGGLLKVLRGWLLARVDVDVLCKKVDLMLKWKYEDGKRAKRIEICNIIMGVDE